MATIVEQTFISPYDNGNPLYNKGIQLRSEEFIRPFSFGNNWSKIRIAVLMGVGMPALPLEVAGLVDIGVCSGNRGIGSGSPLNYVGAGYGATVGGRSALPRFTYATMTGGWPTAGLVLGTGGVYATAVHGSTVDSFYNQIQQGQQTLPGPSSMPFQGVYRRGLIVVDIQRVTSFRYTAYLYYDASLSAFCDITYKTMMDACDQPFLTNLTNLAGYNLQTNAMVAMTYSNFLGQVTTQAYTDSAGPLNCVNIAWNMSTISMTIWAVAVARFQ